MPLADGDRLGYPVLVMAKARSVPDERPGSKESLYARRSAHLPELGAEREHWVEFKLSALRRASRRPKDRRKYKHRD